MKRSVAGMLVFLAGCSTAPLANFLDFVAPGRLGPERVAPYGGVNEPRPIGGHVPGTPPDAVPVTPAPPPRPAPFAPVAPPPGTGLGPAPAFGAPPAPVSGPGTLTPTSVAYPATVSATTPTSPAPFSTLGIRDASPMPVGSPTPASTTGDR